MSSSFLISDRQDRQPRSPVLHRLHQHGIGRFFPVVGQQTHPLGLQPGRLQGGKELRQPLGPKECNPQWVIGNIMQVIFVDAVTGEISDWCPAFPRE